jgi:hypothetical protein
MPLCFATPPVPPETRRVLRTATDRSICTPWRSPRASRARPHAVPTVRAVAFDQSQQPIHLSAYAFDDADKVMPVVTSTSSR